MHVSYRRLALAAALAASLTFAPWPADAQFLGGLVAGAAGAAHARVQQQQFDAAARIESENPQAVILWYVEDTTHGGFVSGALFAASDCLDTANAFNQRARTLQYLCVFRVAPFTRSPAAAAPPAEPAHRYLISGNTDSEQLIGGPYAPEQCQHLADRLNDASNSLMYHCDDDP